MMRFALQLLTLIALLFAPLAAPAAAMTSAQASASECSQMHPAKAPASHHRTGEPCCIAVPPAITTPPVATRVFAAALHLPFIAPTEQFHLGAGPQFEDPPPRIA